MATLAELTSGKALVRHESYLEAWEMPHRFIYYPSSFEDWVVNAIASQPRDRSRDLTPYEQVEQAFHDFIINRPLVYGQDRRKLTPLHRHVWELKTEDVRIVGWFPAKATFIAVCGSMKRDLKPSSKYTPLVDETCSFRDRLPLNPPKMLEGFSHADIL